MNANILLVEDEENLRVTLEDNLEEEGYEVLAVATAQAARQAMVQPWDLIILDIMLPDGDGYQLCRGYREQGGEAMILMLTARSLEDDLLRGFSEGADDYLSKPYRLRELLARIQALLRRRLRSKCSLTLRFGEFCLDPKARSLSRGPERIELTRTEFNLLHLFLKRSNQALSRDEILDEVWGREVVVDPRTVDNFVFSLKKKLAWRRGASWRIRTVRGVGYRWEG